MSVKNVIKYWFAVIASKFKLYTVHTEAILIDSVWEEAKKRIKKVHKWFVMTPVNYDYFKSSFNIQLTREHVEDVLIKRYRWLIQNNQKLELHLHLSLLMNLSYSEQKKIIEEAIDWMKEKIGIEVKEMVPGWWCFNEDTKQILKEKGIKLVKFKDYNSEHDYEWVFNSGL
ncbi:MAG: hypothetical protein ABIH51_00885 [Patescibacteria group bacterium]